jgi:hypothetical protein
MDKARLGGMLICIVAVALLVLFYVGLGTSGWGFWAVAIPVAIGVTLVMLLGIWIGWTMLSTKVELPPADDDDDTTAAE